MGKDGANSVQTAALGHNKGNLQKHIDGIIDDERKIATLKASLMLKYKKADDDGFDSKELKMIVKNKTRPLPIEFKRGVNNMCETLGEQLIFNLPPIPKNEREEEKKEVKKEKAA